MRILVEARKGDPGTCAYSTKDDPCKRPRYVVHDSYRPYKPTEKEVEIGRIPFDKVCDETFCCSRHFNEHYARNGERYLPMSPAADFTFTATESYNKKGVFKHDKGK